MRAHARSLSPRVARIQRNALGPRQRNALGPRAAVMTASPVSMPSSVLPTSTAASPVSTHTNAQGESRPRPRERGDGCDDLQPGAGESVGAVRGEVKRTGVTTGRDHAYSAAGLRQRLWRPPLTLTP
jgi:hypothetical protein